MNWVKKLKANPDLVEVGYQKEIKLKNGLKVVIELVGKNHDTKSDGTKASLSFVLRDLLGKDDRDNLDAPMNDDWSNDGGWKDCKMRKWLNTEVIENLLPDYLSKEIELVKKGTYCDGRYVVTSDKLWLLSETELFGRSIYSKGEEGKQYKFFKYYRNRIKGHLGSDCADWYWERSSLCSYTGYFCLVSGNGSANYGSANYSRGVAFGFCL